MSQTLRLFAAAKKAAGLQTDYQLAKRLRLSTARMSTYKRGVELQEDEVIIEAAKLAGWNPLETLAEFQAIRAKTDLGRSSWTEIARLARIYGRAAAIFAVSFLAWIAAAIFPVDAEASSEKPSSAGVELSAESGLISQEKIHNGYIMRRSWVRSRRPPLQASSAYVLVPPAIFH